jgi:Zn-finger nucleic acid-binding protein
MEIVRKPFAELDVCPRCGGIFLDRGEGTALHGADSDASFLVEDGRARLVRASELACPSAAHEPAFMDVFAVGYEGEQIEFEHCRACKGVFLDRSEDEALEEAEGREVRTASGARFSAPPGVDHQSAAIEQVRAEKGESLFARFFGDLVRGTGQVVRDGYVDRYGRRRPGK